VYRLSGESRYRCSVKIWLVIVLLVPALAWAEQQPVELHEAAVDPENPPAEDANEPLDDGEPPLNWVDTSHTVAADSAQALVEWMDNFFGDPSYDLEKAESYLRLEFENDWEQYEGNDFGVRLRGKVQLPKISQRVDLLFSEEDSEAADRQDRDQIDNVSLQVKVREGDRSRFDATMGYSSGNLKPGVRYRNEGGVELGRSYRYIQRIQYEDGEGFFTLGSLDLFQALNNNDVVRWGNRIKFGEDTDGVEWRTRLSLFQRWYEDSRRPLAVNYFATVRGDTRPKSYTKNYRLGAVVRRQIYRDFLFAEIEPAVNYRRPEYDAGREIAWSFVVRLEIALSRDLARRSKRRQAREDDSDNDTDSEVGPNPGI
jgi:hypothetical protein